MNDFDLVLKAKNELQETKTFAQACEIKAKYLGKGGIIGQISSKMKNAKNEDERRTIGSSINLIKREIEDCFSSRIEEIERDAISKKINADFVDLDVQMQSTRHGIKHPVAKVLDEILSFFTNNGFSVIRGNSIEDDWHNFEALNFPPNHPARRMHDTFYLTGDRLLRTHTSNMQIRSMLENKPPFSFVSPGRVYRSENQDSTHVSMFHQVEGVVVDRCVSAANLKYMLIEFVRHFFNSAAIEYRIRPSFFPFTEPSIELDIKMGNKWLEILGAGMIHKNVLKVVGIDYTEYRGLAFGMGVERLMMLKYFDKSVDLRDVFDGNIEWLYKNGFNLFGN